MSGFYVPTASTPNRDNVNDVFKRLFFGNLVQFDMKIYNRYGQIVFVTSDVVKGWDGTIKGLQQYSGNSVWVCHYQLVGKGTGKIGQFVMLR